MSPRCQTAPVSTIDLNADLGEGFGVWRLGDDDALLGIVTSANVACGFHAGDPSTMRRVCEPGGGGGCRRRRPGVLPRPRRLRPPLHRRGTGRARRRRALPAGRARRDRPGQRQPGVLRQAARRALQRRRRPRGAGPGRRRRRRRLRRPAAGARAARLRAAARGGGGRPAHGRARASPTAATPPAGTLVSRREPGALVHDPAAVAERAVRMAVDGEVVAVDGTRAAGRRSSRSACTATPRAPSSWPGRCGRRWRRPASRRPPSRADRQPASRPACRSVARRRPGEQVAGDVVHGPALPVGAHPEQLQRGGCARPRGRRSACPSPPRPPPGAAGPVRAATRGPRPATSPTRRRRR